MSRFRRFGALVVGSVLMLSACSIFGGDRSDMEPTITQEQAEKTVEENFRNTLAALENPPEPERQYQRLNYCLNPTDGGSEERRFVSLSYVLRNLSEQQYQNYFDQAKTYWQEHGWHIRSDLRPDGDFIGVDDPDGRFGMSIQGNDKGNVFIASDSHCIWPDGTPPPSVTE